MPIPPRRPGARWATVACWSPPPWPMPLPTTTSPTPSRAPAKPWPNAARNWCMARARWRRSRAMALVPFWQGLGLPYGWAWFLSQSVFIVVICLILMLSVAAVILADRKIWAAVQMRRGPNVVGPFGLLQTIADALKFLFKEVIIPAGANKVIFFLAPLVSVMVAFIAWALIPFNKGWVIADINVGILYLFALSSLCVYATVMAGWASNSKYPFLSALRAAAQMVSYEVSIGFVMITVLLFAGSLNISQIVASQETASWAGFLHWNVFTILFPMLVIFFVS